MEEKKIMMENRKGGVQEEEDQHFEGNLLFIFLFIF
jgi:hypothetical protein